jgi:hypothetical protein
MKLRSNRSRGGKQQREQGGEEDDDLFNGSRKKNATFTMQGCEQRVTVFFFAFLFREGEGNCYVRLEDDDWNSSTEIEPINSVVD